LDTRKSGTIKIDKEPGGSVIVIKPRIVVYDLDDGWHGVYLDGKLFAGTDNWNPRHLYDLLVFSGLLEKGLVEFKVDDDLDQKVSYTGEFPERDPNLLK
jgi:hypothetical protein